MNWHLSLGISASKFRFHDHDKLAHYANAAADIEFEFPFGFKELEGIHSRTDFDLGAHEKFSGKKLRYHDPEINKSYVPYVVEAWPEGNMAHLSAESALYCRIFTEGILGITPTGFHSFDLTPNIPDNWDYFNLKNIRAFNANFDVLIKREGNQLQVNIVQSGKSVSNKKIDNGTSLQVHLSK
jgi:hypothetical protein